MTDKTEDFKCDLDPRKEDSKIVNMLNEYFLFNQDPPESKPEGESPTYKEIQDWFEESREKDKAFVLYNNEKGKEESPISLTYEDVVAILNIPFVRGMEFKPQYSEVIEPYFDYNKIPELGNSGQEAVMRNRRGEKGVWEANFLYFNPAANESVVFRYSFFKATNTARLRLNCFK